MKKLLSVLMSAVLVFGSLACGIIMTSAGTKYETLNDATYTSPFYFDFSTEESYNDMNEAKTYRTWVNNTLGWSKNDQILDWSYSKEEKALDAQMDASGKNIMLDLRCLDWRDTLSLEKYTTLALKVKLTNTNAVLKAAQMVVNNGAVTVPNTLHTLTNVPAYEKHTDWQLVLIDLSRTNWPDTLETIQVANEAAEPDTVSVWWGTRVELAKNATTGSIYVQWAGIFENEEKAKTQFAKTTPKKTADTNYLFDFSTEAKYTDMTDYGVNGNTTRPDTILQTNNASPRWNVPAYSVENAAMKLQGNGKSTVILDFQCNSWRSALDMTTHKTIALKVKLSDPTAVMGAATVRVNDNAACYLREYTEGETLGTNETTTTVSTENGEKTYVNNNKIAANLHNLIKSDTYKATTDWQLVLIDLSENNWANTANTDYWTLSQIAEVNGANGTASHWWGARLVLTQASYTGDVYIQWAGIFEDDADAIAYYNGTTPVKSLGTKIGQDRDSLRYGFSIEASGVGYVAGNRANAVSTVNYSRNDLTANAATILVDGVEYPITDFGAIVSTVEGQTEATLTNDAVNDGKIKKVSAARLYAVNGSTIEYCVEVLGITTDYTDRVICARPYVAYTDGEETKYLYGHMLSDFVDAWPTTE